jgi:MFS family permease
LSKTNRSRGSQFLHDLVTVDFGKVDLYTGIRIATLLAPLLVLGLITKHQSGLVVMGFIWVAIMDEILPTGQRTRTLLSVSIIYASIFAIGMLVSMTNYLVLPLLALGLFLLSYLRVYPRLYLVLLLAALNFAIGVVMQGATLTLIGETTLLVLIGELWVILAGAIFPAHKYLKSHRTTNQSVQQQRPQQQQPSPKLTRQDRVKLFTSNLSIHSQYFQYALALTLTSVVGLLITQWFDLKEPQWVLVTIVAVLMRPQLDISSSFSRGVHRLIGTFIGAIIAIAIIGTTDNQWFLTLLTLLFAGAYVSLAKTGNYAFTYIFVTAAVLLTLDIANPSTGLTDSYARFQNVAIGCLLSLLVIFIMWIIPKRKSDRALGSIRE